jgi:trk system potassium uptake protein
MKIIVVGAGSVGTHLARVLSREDHNVVIIDPNASRLNRLAEQLDLGIVVGSGVLRAVLEQAGAKDADYIIAASSLDEVNLLCCMVAKEVGVPHRIARIRNSDLAYEIKSYHPEILTVSPELATAREVVDLAVHAGARDYLEMLGGQIRLISLDVEQGGPLAGRSLVKLSQSLKDLTFRIVALVRDGITLIPSAKEIFEPGDTVTFALRSRDTLNLFKLTGHGSERYKRVMILGSSIEAQKVAEDMAKIPGTIVKLFPVKSDDHGSSTEIAEVLPDVHIYDAGVDEKHIDAMAREALGEMDVLLALSNDEEKNIITSLLAKHLGVKLTVTMIQDTAYMPLVKTIGLDVGVNTRLIAAQEMLKSVQLGHMTGQQVLGSCGAQLLVFRLDADTPLAGCTLPDLQLPSQTILAGIMRRGHAFVPTGEDRIEARDELLLVTLESQIKELEHFFS